MKIGESLSRPGRPSTGCPQGTVLGSLLFVLFVDEVKMVLGHTDFSLYADDLKLLRVIRSPSDQAALQRVLSDFHIWSRKMGMQLSPSKCQVLRLGPLRDLPSYSLGSHTLEVVSVAKDLGVLIDRELKFSQHVNHIVSKCSRLCSWILRAFIIRDH